MPWVKYGEICTFYRFFDFPCLSPVMYWNFRIKSYKDVDPGRVKGLIDLPA